MSEDSTADAREVVLSFFKTAIIQKRVQEGALQWLDEGYRQHNPEIADGRDGIMAALTGLHAQFPDFEYSIKRVIADGDLVAIHGHVRMNTEDRGTAAADIFRVAGGKVVEHWDVLQPVPAEAANENTMF
jgi:predicted SnoaL-like aldol condensation-catalyzing enzyme